MRNIRLYGELGRRFGRLHRLDVRTAAEAVRALTANFPGFPAAILEVAERYRVIVGRDRLDDPEQLNAPSSDRETIRIIPVVAGAKRGGLAQVLIGVGIIAAAFVTGGASLVATGLFGFGTALSTTTLGSIALGIGTSLILGGISQMLTPVPKMDAGRQEGEAKTSSMFSGTVNASSQGVPVPVGYGRMIVGSAVISAGLSTMEAPL